MRALVIVITLFGLGAHAQVPGPKGSNAIKNDWLALLANGCDLTKHKVYTPFETSVLRNTPYALKGYAFKSEGLRALFGADGKWYVPKSNATPKFAPPVSACIKAIKTYEKAMKFAGLKGFKELIFKEYDTYLDIRAHNQMFIGGAVSTRTDSKALADGSWHANLECPKCKKLQTYQLMCSKSLGCALVVPGDGSLIVE